LPAVLSDPARLAVSVTDCDISAITFVGETRTYWKSVPHLPYGGAENWQNAVGDSFCYLAVGVNGPFIVQDAASDPRTAGHPAIGPWGVGAWAGFPIVSAGGQAIGTMCVIDAKPRVWQPSELETARAALARSSELARGLQDSLLPPLLRPVPGLDTAARYLPASGDEPVVGDFYDLFQVRGRWWTAVMGDVCGKGTEAAKVTALAHYILRADVGEHLSPAAVLDRLNSAMLAQQGPALILLYTDGACEARADPDRPGPREPMFDDEALTRTLADSRGLDAAATTGHIAAALAARHGGWASDDTALLALPVPPLDLR
jgi:hypothetical protein